MIRQENQLLERPIIIVGTPRSGTTFLGNVLKHHPSLAYVNEPRLTWRYGNDHKSDRLDPDDARPEVCEHIRSVFAEAVRTAGRHRLLEKTPSNTLRLGFVERVLPGCQFIHILRDGVESVLSIRRFWEQHAVGIKPRVVGQRLREVSWRRIPYYFKEVLRRSLPKRFSSLTGQPVWGPRIPGIDGLLRDLDLLEVCCIQWRMCVEAACQFGRRLPEHRYMECRLEEMSPELLQSVLQFAELDESEEVGKAFEQLFNPTLPGGRRGNADPEEIDRIRQSIEPTLKWLGYEA